MSLIFQSELFKVNAFVGQQLLVDARNQRLDALDWARRGGECVIKWRALRSGR